MDATSSIDLEKFYPDDLVILTVEEKADSIILYMQSKSTEFTCPCCIWYHMSIMELTIVVFRTCRYFRKLFGWISMNMSTLVKTQFVRFILWQKLFITSCTLRNG